MRKRANLSKHNMEIHKDLEQRTDEWYELRRKYPLTASNAQAIGNGAKGLETLIWDVLAEKYSFADKENITNKDMERGVELEAQARAIYELETGNIVTEVGFVTNEKVSPVCGASPDGMIGEDGLLEIKCFEDAKHFKYAVNGLEIESKYEWQVQMQMLVTERRWCDFVAYNPNYKKSLLVKRIEADAEKQKQIIEGLGIGAKLIKEIENKL